LVGDHDPQVIAHQGIQATLELLSTQRNRSIEWNWLSTSQLTTGAQEVLHYEAIWCIPASPYKSEAGALAAIQAARTNRKPFLGTCGGCQHAILEYARNVLGISSAENEEENPEAALPLISALSCSLVEADDEICFTPGSIVEKLYGTGQAHESYHCRYGLNPKLEYLLAGSELEITGRDKNGEARAFEITSQRFYILTQYQPERKGLTGRVHPIISAFIRAAEEQKDTPV